MLDLETIGAHGDDRSHPRLSSGTRRSREDSSRRKAFMSWWLAVLAIAAAVLYAFSTGAAQHVFLGDVTRITWATAALALVVTIVLGRAAYEPRGAERSLEIGLFAEDACMRLGMFGTVIGCLIMFGADIASFDAGDASKTAALIQKISSSFGTAIGTTAVGIAASLCIKLQNAILQHAIDGD
jgi:drug/metabolite transporter (DMT)-like permease